MQCPLCGSEIIDLNGRHCCARFPICNYVMSEDNKNIFNPDKNTYIVFDLETTGLNKASDRIIEIGAVKVQDGKVIDDFDMLVNPGKKENGINVSISSTIKNLTGISNELVANQPLEKEALREFFKWCNGIDLVIGHNIASFDIPFVKAACRRNGLEFPFSAKVDTLLFVKSLKLQKNGVIENNKQTTLADYVDLKYSAHRANEDTKALCEILKRLVKKEHKMPLIEKI